MALQHPESLRTWLSQWLAIQSLICLGSVCLAVYVALDFSLAARRAQTTEHRQRIIEQLVTKVRLPEDVNQLERKLNALFEGNPNLHLELSSANSGLLYRSPEHQFPDTAHGQIVTFEVDLPMLPGEKVQATLAEDLSADIHLQTRLAWILFASALGGAAMISIGGAWLTRRALAPVNNLARQATTLSPERLTERLDGSGQAEELQPLVTQFNAVLERLERAYVQLEGFNADVAHELRTPLATLMGESELALKGRYSADELRDVVASNLEELQRLSRLVNDMLFLSNADRGVKARGSWTPSLAMLVAEVVEYHDAALMEAGLTAIVVGDGCAHVDRRLLRQALSNLLSNATRYAPAGSAIKITIVTLSEGEIAFSVSNSGTEIAAEHLPRLFDRFYRTDSAREYRGDNNHGLGLAIVAAIARMHGGRVYANSANGRTTVGFLIPIGPATRPDTERQASPDGVPARENG